jgi:minor histocompatibility antigen H13
MEKKDERERDIGTFIYFSFLELFRVTLTVIHLIILAVSLALAVTFGITKHWTVSNIFAICIAINAIKFVKIDSFKTGFVLLMGMLIYDLVWIFGTDMMLTISKALADSPTRIVWPRNVHTYFMDSLLKDHYFTLFGLGDIIIPG